MNVSDSDGKDRRHEPACDSIRHALNGRTTPLGRSDHVHDLRQQRVGADLVGTHHEAAVSD